MIERFLRYSLAHNRKIRVVMADSLKCRNITVIALEGDTLEIRDGMTYLNGQALQEEYVTHPAQEDFGSVTVEPGHVFVLGDNRANSHDSRTEGTLTESSIVGRAVCVLFPFDQIKTLNAPQE